MKVSASCLNFPPDFLRAAFRETRVPAATNSFFIRSRKVSTRLAGFPIPVKQEFRFRLQFLEHCPNELWDSRVSEFPGLPSHFVNGN